MQLNFGKVEIDHSYQQFHQFRHSHWKLNQHRQRNYQCLLEHRRTFEVSLDFLCHSNLVIFEAFLSVENCF